MAKDFMPKINDTIRLLKALPDEALPVGSIGVIVEEFRAPHEAYEIEFCDKNGATIAQVALRPDDFSVVN